VSSVAPAARAASGAPRRRRLPCWRISRIVAVGGRPCRSWPVRDARRTGRGPGHRRCAGREQRGRRTQCPAESPPGWLALDQGPPTSARDGGDRRPRRRSCCSRRAWGGHRVGAGEARAPIGGEPGQATRGRGCGRRPTGLCGAGRSRRPPGDAVGRPPSRHRSSGCSRLQRAVGPSARRSPAGRGSRPARRPGARGQRRLLHPGRPPLGSGPLARPVLLGPGRQWAVDRAASRLGQRNPRPNGRSGWRDRSPRRRAAVALTPRPPPDVWFTARPSGRGAAW